MNLVGTKLYTEFPYVYYLTEDGSKIKLVRDSEIYKVYEQALYIGHVDECEIELFEVVDCDCEEFRDEEGKDWDHHCYNFMKLRQIYE